MANTNEKIEALANVQAVDAADLRTQIAALTQNIGLLAAAALAPKPRATRGNKAVAATVSEADRACSAGGFRRGYRGQMFRDLLGKGPGVFALSEIEPVASGYAARSALPVAQAIARRLSRLPAVGYLLVVDTDENDAGKTELVFSVRTAADPVSTEPEIESGVSE